MRIGYLLLTTLLFTANAYAGNHPLKMSFSKLTVSAQDSVNLETRIFLDDLTDHIQELYQLPQADFSTLAATGTQALQNYLTDHVYLQQGEEKILLWIKSVATSKNQLALVVNLGSAKPLDRTKEIYLINTLLCDASPMQTNDVKYREDHYLLSYGKPRIKIRLE